ncbi:ATP-binding protein [Halobacteriovorax sp. HFRX-2_2]|uniref:sensor histidine kinase n=1 Tax=unclassified Halobacteriovorax TaxID=2639665 RepID=UPI00371FA58E
MDSIIILYAILLGFLVLCTASVFLVSAVDRYQDYLDFKKFLVTVILAYFINFTVGVTPHLAAGSFCLQFFPIFFLSNYILAGQKRLSLRYFGLLHLTGISISFALSFWTQNFTAFSLPLVLSAYSPGFAAIYYILKRKSSLTNFFYVFVMSLGALNFISFSVFRFVPGTELWGWSAAVLNYILIMYCFFLMILDKKVILDAELKDELKLTNTLYKTLIHDTSNDLNYLSFSLSRAIKRDDISFVEKANERLNELIRFKTEIRKQYQSDKGISHKVSMINILSRIENNFLDLYRLKGIQLVKSIKNESDDINIPISEEVLIKTILGNLLSNALKFSPQGAQVHLSIDVCMDMMHIQVIDSGKGIPEHIVNEVKTYSKVTSSTGTNHEMGTGMGLGIVCFVVDRVKGEIEFTSRKNKGTTIDIKIPTVASQLINGLKSDDQIVHSTLLH